MSSVLQKLRIIAIPLTRPNVSRTLPHPKTKPSRLVYYQFQIALDPPPSIPLDKDSDPANAKKKGWLPKEGVATWATNKAVDKWADFGKEKSGWKVCMFFFIGWNAMIDGFLRFSRKCIALESG
jgi:Mitochondrial K+-H+ exchange-related